MALAFESWTGTAGGNSASSSQVGNLPATINAGDILVCIQSMEGGGTVSSVSDSTSDSWTVLDDTNAFTVSGGNASCSIKVADGDEDGGTVTVTTSDARYWSIGVIRISGGSGTSSIGTAATGNNVNPDCPTVTASWGSDDNLFIAYGGLHDDGETVSSYPSGYSNGNYQQANGTSTNNNATAWAAVKAATAATDNPGTASVSSTATWVSNTLVLQPASTGATAPVFVHHRRQLDIV